MHILSSIKSKLSSITVSYKTVKDTPIYTITTIDNKNPDDTEDDNKFYIKYKTKDLEFLQINKKINNSCIMNVKKINNNRIDTEMFYDLSTTQYKINNSRNDNISEFDKYLLIKLAYLLNFLQNNKIYLKILLKEDINLNKNGLFIFTGIDKFTNTYNDIDKIFADFTGRVYKKQLNINDFYNENKNILDIDNFNTDIKENTNHFLIIEKSIKNYDNLQIIQKEKLTNYLTDNLCINELLKVSLTNLFIKDVVKKNHPEDFIFKLCKTIKLFKLKNLCIYLPIILELKDKKISDLFLLDKSYFIENGMNLNNNLLVEIIIKNLNKNSVESMLIFIENNLKLFEKNNAISILKNINKMKKTRCIKQIYLNNHMFILNTDKKLMIEFILFLLRNDDIFYLEFIELIYRELSNKDLCEHILPELCKKLYKNNSSDAMFNLIENILKIVREKVKNNEESSSYFSINKNEGSYFKMVSKFNVFSKSNTKTNPKETKKITSNSNKKITSGMDHIKNKMIEESGSIIKSKISKNFSKKKNDDGWDDF